MTYSHECRTFYADPYPTATPAMSAEMQRTDREVAAWLAAHPGATELDYWRTMEPGDPDDAPEVCAICGGAGEVEDEEGFFTDCPDCAAEQDAIRAEIDADLDALHDAAARYRAAGIDPQLAGWMARHRMG